MTRLFFQKDEQLITGIWLIKFSAAEREKKETVISFLIFGFSLFAGTQKKILLTFSARLNQNNGNTTINTEQHQTGQIDQLSSSGDLSQIKGLNQRVEDNKVLVGRAVIGVADLGY